MNSTSGAQPHSTSVSRASALVRQLGIHVRGLERAWETGNDAWTSVAAFALRYTAEDLLAALREVLLAQGIDPPPDRTLDQAKRAL